MKATCFSETSGDFRPTTQRYIPEDITLHDHRCENLKSYNSQVLKYPCQSCLVLFVCPSAAALDASVLLTFPYEAVTHCAFPEGSSLICVFHVVLSVNGDSLH
jgi:hypothetical protein